MVTSEKKKLYLITGFLGAGKTTLMKELIQIFSDKKIAIIVNEFGEQGVDGAILEGKGLEVKEISNGSIFCVCRSDLFVDTLVQALKTQADIVLVETSGLSDPTGFDKILQIVKQLAGDAYNYCGTIAVVDATNFHKLIHTAVAVSQQIVSSQLVLINKIDLVDESILENIEKSLEELNSGATVKRTAFSIIQNPEWITKLDASLTIDIDKFIKKRVIGTQKILLKIQDKYSKNEIEQWVNEFLETIYRIKGFIELKEGWHYIDGTAEKVNILPTSIKNQESYIVILASGDSPVKEQIKKSCQKHSISSIDKKAVPVT